MNEFQSSEGSAVVTATWGNHVKVYLQIVLVDSKGFDVFSDGKTEQEVKVLREAVDTLIEGGNRLPAEKSPIGPLHRSLFQAGVGRKLLAMARSNLDKLGKDAQCKDLSQELSGDLDALAGLLSGLDADNAGLETSTDPMSIDWASVLQPFKAVIGKMTSIKTLQKQMPVDPSP